MNKTKKLTIIVALGLACVMLATTVVFLVQVDDALANAARNSNSITIVANYNHSARSLEAHQTVAFRNRTGHEKREVKFHIFANAYREGAAFAPVQVGEYENAFPNGRSFGHIDIHNVAAGGDNVTHTIGGEDKNVLIVPLANPLAPNQSVNIVMEYTVHLANAALRLGYTDRVVNLSHFYPVPVRKCCHGQWQPNTYSYNGDPFYNDLHNFDVTLTKPANFLMASSGTIQRVTEENNTTTTRVISRAIRSWAAALSPYFQSVQRVVNRVTVSYFFLDDPEPMRSLETSVLAKQTFSRLFVQFPYRQLTVVQTDFLHGGMEYGEIVFISNNITERDEIDRVIVHEIAHQWWYGIIGNDQVRTAWIDEGLAEYSTLLFFDENPDFGVNRRDYLEVYRRNLAMFIGLVNGVGGVVNKDMNRSLFDFNSTYEYIYMTYVRGMLLFADLEQIIGRDAMKASLRNLAREHKFGFVNQQKLVASFENTTNIRLGLFFESYLQGV